MNLTQVIMISTGIFAACTDIKTGRIPNRLTYGSVLALMLSAVYTHSLVVAIEGMVVTCLPLLLLYLGTGGRGLGLGDVKFASVMGAALGALTGLEAVACAFVMGACVGGIGLIMGVYHRKSRIAFGPYLALGSWCAMLLQAGGGWP